ncbi:homing endonuclease [Glomus cerebriforme]|uniref:Homing endonuclease n=1 Tax=Glomus cerebriforme TaxID=658196 RepID=A0A397SMQ4_9GLOM|nr:homing endonuclease [Glomus cerebriforme]
METYTFILSNLIKSYKRLPPCGNNCRILHTYSFSLGHGKALSNGIVLGNKPSPLKRKLSHFTEAFSSLPSKLHVVLGPPNTGKTALACGEYKSHEGKFTDASNQLEDNSSSKIIVISDHLKKHAKPLSDEAFGYYLAGLIEANSYISNRLLEINFDKKEASLAYYIKSRIGFGRVFKYENKPSIKYLLDHPQGLKVILTLINGKFLTTNKIDQLLKNKYDQKYGITILPPADFKISQNHFLAGFCDADGYFSIVTSNDTSDCKINLCFFLESQLQNQKESTIFQKVQSEFGGSFYLNKEMETYHYEAASFQTIFKIIKYFDNFNLNSSKYVNYFKWRKAYRIIQRGEHLNKNGLAKIVGLKNSMYRNESK